ncbi:MAG: hypothetical protein GF344_20385, partial [Chitinivibrionales bacterium]|nr:hypothetical protein [Chitinivibrionales bacterium]MBD3358960.1 hypothetical protein [Chitinivibrionales bacterium]
MKAIIFRVWACFLLVWFPVAMTMPLYAQVDDFTGDDFFGEDSSMADTEPQSEWEKAVEIESANDAAGQESTAEKEEGGESETTDAETLLFGGDEPAPPAPKGGESMVQNAVIEGVQISSEQGAEPHEKIITVYFIFRDEPTSYFYEAQHRGKKIVFEFNDTEMGISPIPSAKEPPIQGFRIEQDKVDINAQIRGLKPDWHDLVRVSFFMDEIPEITVKQEYSIVSFSFKWSTDPDKVKA